MGTIATSLLNGALSRCIYNLTSASQASGSLFLSFLVCNMTDVKSQHRGWAQELRWIAELVSVRNGSSSVGSWSTDLVNSWLQALWLGSWSADVVNSWLQALSLQVDLEPT